jgi:hypothetical protein
MEKQKKFIYLMPLLTEFLTSKGIKWGDTDADIVYFEIESVCHNDTEFVKLILEYAKFIDDNDEDMAINREAMGGSYHRDRRDK